MYQLIWQEQAALRLGSGQLALTDGASFVTKIVLPKGEYYVWSGRRAGDDYDAIVDVLPVGTYATSQSQVGEEIDRLDIETAQILFANAAAVPDYDIWYYGEKPKTPAQGYYIASLPGDMSCAVHAILNEVGARIGVRVIIDFSG